MAKNTLSGAIIDYFSGLNDIKNKKIRVLHNKSFIEDPSRILRALKFSVRFNFELEENTKKLQEEYLNNINYNNNVIAIFDNDTAGNEAKSKLPENLLKNIKIMTLPKHKKFKNYKTISI